MASSSVQAAFVANNLPYAQSVSAQTGIPVAYVLSQSAYETGWGTSNAAQTLNNYFGIGPGQSYASPAAGFDAFGTLMQTPRYSGVASAATSPQAYGDALEASGYGGLNGGIGSAYGAALTPIVSTVNNLLAASGNATSTAPAATPAAAGAISAAAPATGTTATGTAASATPATWFGSWAGDFAARAAFVLLAIVMLLGAVYLFGKRTDATIAAAP